MSKATNQTVVSVFECWRTEDRELEASVCDLREWMKEVEQLGIPHFGETATRLSPLRGRLVLHFQREDEMISQLAASLPEPSSEFDNLRNGAAYDHDSLLARLDDLSERLKETDPKFPSWQAAMAEVKSFVDRLEEHEAMEVMNIESCLAKTAVK